MPLPVLPTGATLVAVADGWEGASEACTAAVLASLLTGAAAAGLLVLDLNLSAAAMTGSDDGDCRARVEEKSAQVRQNIYNKGRQKRKSWPVKSLHARA